MSCMMTGKNDANMQGACDLLRQSEILKQLWIGKNYRCKNTKNKKAAIKPMAATNQSIEAGSF